MATNIIKQNAGFIAAESKRAQEDLARSKEFRDQGNERAAKSYATRANNRIERVNKAAETIKDRSSSK